MLPPIAGRASRASNVRLLLRRRRRRDGRVVMQRIANPCTPVRFRVAPPVFRLFPINRGDGRSSHGSAPKSGDEYAPNPVNHTVLAARGQSPHVVILKTPEPKRPARNHPRLSAEPFGDPVESGEVPLPHNGPARRSSSAVSSPEKSRN